MPLSGLRRLIGIGRPAPDSSSRPGSDRDAGFQEGLELDLDADLEQAFDVGFYVAQGDAREIDPAGALGHYLETGWKEGLDPAPWFSTMAYLAAYGDVRAAGINPLVHYLRFGRWEGRSAGVRMLAEDAERPGAAGGADSPEANAADPGLAEPDAAAADASPGAGIDPDCAARIAGQIAAEFNPSYYLSVNPDVAEAGTDPVLHYVTEGWAEGRDPTPDFSTRYYLDSNPDVRAEGLNPFWHYIVAGRDENRLPREPGGYKAQLLKELVPLERTVEAWCSAPRETADADLRAFGEALRRALKRGTGRLVVGFTHDDYRRSVGGVQLCVLREEQAAMAAGHAYLALRPAQPLPRLAKTAGAEDVVVELTLNGEDVGAAPIGQVVAAAARARPEASPVSLVVHSLMGHAPEAVAAAAAALQVDDAWFWLHDNFSLCPSYALLRNGITFCGAPDPGSQACGICVYGAERTGHLRRLRALFEAVPFTAVAPSEAELALWTGRSDLPVAATVVHPHLALDTAGARRRDAAGREGPLRVGFAGIASAVKGWPAFRSLAESSAGAGDIEFHYFGVDDPGSPAITAHRVAVTPERRTAMRDALIEAGIDLVFLWSACPETFSFTAYEALAAGAAIVTHGGTGNVAALVRETGRGKVLDDEAALHAFFSDGEARALAQGNRLGAECGASFILGRMTVDLIENEAGNDDTQLHQLHV